MNTQNLKTEMIPVDKILYSSDNYNKYPKLLEKQAEGDYYQAILKSIGEEGLKNPLVVRPKDRNGQHKLYIGNNRLSAVKELGQIEIPCIVGEFTREQVKNIKTTTYKAASSDPK